MPASGINVDGFGLISECYD